MFVPVSTPVRQSPGKAAAFSRFGPGVCVPEPSWEKLSQSSRKLSRTFALSTPVNNYYYTNSNNTTTSDNSELLAVMKRMDAYLRDPKNRQAVISRKMQLEFDRMETEIKQLARL